MSIDVRLPNINGRTDTEQLAQIKSYLYQFAEQIQWAFNTVQSGSGTGVVPKTTGTGKASAKEDPVSNFNQLKGLIIKSADIVTAYYEKIDELLKLSGDYTASSAFGDFQELTNQTISANSTSIEQLFTNLEQITDTVDGLYDSVISAKAYLKSGRLYYADNGAPVYGLEIGQTNEIDSVEVFNKFARFTADRLSFYDANDIEVAYVSDYRLVITNAWIKGNLKIGPGFEFDTSNGLALRWVEEG